MPQPLRPVSAEEEGPAICQASLPPRQLGRTEAFLRSAPVPLICSIGGKGLRG